MSQSIALILMAAGDSTRFCADENLPIKKQWLRVGDLALWQKVLQDFCALYKFNEIIITASKKDYEYMKNLSHHTIVLGGKSRCESVRNAIKEVKSEFVLISDVARCIVDKSVVTRLLECTSNADFSCAVPYINVPDTAFYQGRYLQREDIKLIQTPQLSKTNVLREALQAGDEFSDESSAIHTLGKNIDFIKGSPLLKKLTNYEDLAFFTHLDDSNLRDSAILTPPSNESFWGSGFDVHAFEKGKTMVLGGVRIESNVGFKAHSDGDVVLHALCDAILGAINAGDIGQWFPDSAKEFAGADSAILLQEILQYAKSVGFEVSYVDITIMAQIPKITPYKARMQERIAQILDISKSKVSIKATTTESLGFIGRSEGIAVNANACLRFIAWHKFLH
ncbi:bifunctional 2-C-methyl-D-erythritol 4-phosphate cytidylyltransferase/2-C-methyl-D-erythritol 2,4-cyclodiphosphate synthase [Helicobacter sp. 23-1046]